MFYISQQCLSMKWLEISFIEYVMMFDYVLPVVFLYCSCLSINVKLKTDDLCSHTESEDAVQRWLWYAWQTLRSMQRSISQKPPGIIMQLEQTNAAPGTTIYWLTKGTVGKTQVYPDIQGHLKYIPSPNTAVFICKQHREYFSLQLCLQTLCGDTEQCKPT